MKTIRLPVPPTVNSAYGTNKTGRGKGRYRTRCYNAWIQAADWFTASAGLYRAGVRPLVGTGATIVLRLPINLRGDCDNRLKPTLDYLVSRGITPDDSTYRSVTAMRCPVLGRVNWCEVDISNAD